MLLDYAALTKQCVQVMHNTSGSPQVKICGLTNLADAQAAANAGADFLGFVFVERSSRHVRASDLTSWWAELPADAKRVGLFQNPTISEVERVLNQLEVDVLQFHGAESPEFCSQFGLPFWKSVGLARGGSAVGETFSSVAQHYADAEALIVDSAALDKHGEKISGGTGKQFDWALWPNWFPGRLVAAGGLDPGNIGAAVQALNPWAVDVSTGVEAMPGRKDPCKMQQFCAQALK